MGIYDKEQLVKDLILVVNWYGERVHEGFFMKGVFDKYGITIIDRYITAPELWWGNQKIDIDNLSVTTLPGYTVMALAQKAEESYQSLLNSWGCNVTVSA